MSLVEPKGQACAFTGNRSFRLREIILHDPMSLVGNLFGPEVSGFNLPDRLTRQGSDATEQAAAEEASRRARAAAASQTGRRTTLLSGAGSPQSEVASTRRTLLGSTA